MHVVYRLAVLDLFTTLSVAVRLVCGAHLIP